MRKRTREWKENQKAGIMARISVHALVLITFADTSQRHWIFTMSSILWKLAQVATPGRKASTQSAVVSQCQVGAESHGVTSTLVIVTWTWCPNAQVWEQHTKAVQHISLTTRAVASTSGRKRKIRRHASFRKMQLHARKLQTVRGMGYTAAGKRPLKFARILRPCRSLMASRIVDVLDLVAVSMAKQSGTSMTMRKLRTIPTWAPYVLPGRWMHILNARRRVRSQDGVRRNGATWIPAVATQECHRRQS